MRTLVVALSGALLSLGVSVPVVFAQETPVCGPPGQVVPATIVALVGLHAIV